MLRPITKPIATVLITISFASVAFAQELNGHLQVFVTGGMMGRAFTTSFGPKSTTEKDALDVARNIQPGAEIVFKPRSRISFGASFSRLAFATKLKDHNVIYKDSFTYLGPDGRPAVYSAPGKILAYTDTTESAKTNVLAGSVYLNLSKREKVQPFIGGGAGLGLTRIEWHNNPYLDPIVTQLQPQLKLVPERFTSREYVGVLRIVGGANFYPMKHVIVRTAAGFLNGSYGIVGIGFGF